VVRAGRDTRVLCLSVLLGAGPTALSAAARAAAAVEAQTLRARGAHVQTIGPDAGSAEAIGPSLMEPLSAVQALAAGYRQGTRLAT